MQTKPDPLISIYIFCWNEARMLPWALRFYRHRLPGALITVYDNESDDATVEIAKANGCDLVRFSTSGCYDELVLTKLRNTCWNNSVTPWILVVDCDELANISSDDLYYIESCRFNVVRFEGYNMVTMNDGMNEPELDQITHGARSKWYDKCLLFNRTKIASMNFPPGSHQCNPKPKFLNKVRCNSFNYKLFHYKYTSYHLLAERYHKVRDRSANSNRENGLGYHYQITDSELFQEFSQVQSEAINLGCIDFGPELGGSLQ